MHYEKDIAILEASETCSSSVILILAQSSSPKTVNIITRIKRGNIFTRLNDRPLGLINSPFRVLHYEIDGVLFSRPGG